MIRNRFWAPLALSLFALACDSAKKDAKTGDQPGASTESSQQKIVEKKPEAPPLDLPKIEGPVAKVNGAEVSAADFLKEYKATLERYQRARHEVAPALRERLKDNIVRRLVDAEIIRQQAKKLNITIDAAEFDKKWAEHKQRYGTDDQFQRFLERAGASAEDIKLQYQHNMLREKVFGTITNEIAIESAELKAFYEKNKSRYDVPEQIRASHILIRVKPGATPEEKKTRLARAEEALKKANAKGAKFAEIAKEYGEDPTKARGGDLGFFGRGRMVKPFEAVAWKLKDGEVSSVVETSFGYHVIKRTGHKPASKKSFDEVKEMIERSVRSKKRNEVIRESLKKWREESQVEILVKGDPAVIQAAAKQPSRPLKSPTVGKQIGQPGLQLKKVERAPTGDKPPLIPSKMPLKGKKPAPAQK